MANPVIPTAVVALPYTPFTAARKFAAVANGKVYLGKVDTDPTIPENQIPVFLENEDGSFVPAAQPLKLNAGGFLVNNDQIAKFVVTERHAIAVYDTFGVQQFYIPDATRYTEGSSGDNSIFGRTLRVPEPFIPVLPPAASRANKVLGFDSLGNPIGVLPQTGSGTELAIDLANKSDPFKGAAMVGYKKTTVAAVLDTISSVKISQTTSNGMYSAWPQGKVFSHNNQAYCLFNVGASHSSAPLSVYQQISQDGVTWTRLAPRISASTTDLTTWPQGVSAWGAGSDGTNIWCAARFRRVSDESQSKCVLYKSVNNGSVYTPVLDPVPLYDSNGWAPVLMHSFAVLPNGQIAFGYHMYDSEVGIATIDPVTLVVTRNIIFSKESMGGTPMLVEPTIRVYGSRAVGFLRTQNNSIRKAVMWYSDDNCQTFTTREVDGVPNQSPVSLISYQGNTYIFYCGRYRNGNSTNGLTDSPMLTMRVGTDNDAVNMLWENFVEVPIAAVPAMYSDAGPSGTGVQDVCVRGTKIIVCLSSNMGSNVDQAEIYSVTIDLADRRKTNFFLTEEAFTNSARATDFPSNYQFGSVNIVSVGGVNSTIRMNGQQIVQDQDAAVRWGSVAGAASKTHAFNNGPMPAYLTAGASSADVLLWGSSGVTEIRAGTALANASIKLDVATKRITITNPNNVNGVALEANGTITFSANWQHPIKIDGGAQQTYEWVSGTGNKRYKKGTPPTSDSDGTILY
ncbi:phage tailspike protein [Serratia sp. ser-z]